MTYLATRASIYRSLRALWIETISGYLRNLRGRSLSSEKFSEVIALWVLPSSRFQVEIAVSNWKQKSGVHTSTRHVTAVLLRFRRLRKIPRAHKNKIGTFRPPPPPQSWHPQVPPPPKRGIFGAKIAKKKNSQNGSFPEGPGIEKNCSDFTHVQAPSSSPPPFLLCNLPSEWGKLTFAIRTGVRSVRVSLDNFSSQIRKCKFGEIQTRTVKRGQHKNCQKIPSKCHKLSYDTRMTIYDVLCQWKKEKMVIKCRNMANMSKIVVTFFGPSPSLVLFADKS